MKIAHVTEEMCRRSAGLSVAVAAISAASREAGNDVRVFGLSSPDWVAGDNADWGGALATAYDPSRWSGPLGFAPGMARGLQEFAPDVVHLHGLWTYPSIAAYREARRTGAALVVSAHGMLTPVALNYSRWQKRVARALFQDRVLRAASLLHSTSSDENASYQALGLRNRIALIPLGIDVVARPEVARGERRRLLFLGRLHHKKGVDWLIEAWLRLEAEFPDWDLAIVGPQDPSYARDTERFKQAAAGKRVTFTGPLYGDEKNWFVAGSDLFVMPSRSENFGLTAAEALMMEVPVIASRGTPWSGLVDEDAGWWIGPGATALEQSLRAAMQLPGADLQRRGRNGRLWMKRDFSWPVIGEKWQYQYESLLHSSNQ